MEKTTMADGKELEKTTVDHRALMEEKIKDPKPMEKTIVDHPKPMEKTLVDPRKLMEKTMLDDKIKRLWSKFQAGSIEWFVNQHVNSFPQGFISTFLERFNKSKAGMDSGKPLRVHISEVEMAVAAAVNANKQLAAANKRAKKNKKPKASTDFKVVEQSLLSSKRKKKELAVAELVMSRMANHTGYLQYLDSCWPELFWSQEELLEAIDDLLKAEEAEEIAKEAKKREKAEKMAKKIEALEGRVDAELGHLGNATRNSGYVPPF